MQVVERWLKIERKLAIELVVGFGCDVPRRAAPERRALVDLAVAEVDREGDEIGVFLDGLLDAPAFKKFGRIVLQVKFDRRPTLLAHPGTDRERIAAGRFPA